MKRKMIALTATVCLTAALIPTASFAEGEAITRAYTENGNTVAEIVNAENGTVIAARYTGGTLTAVKYADVSDAENDVVTIEGIEADKVFLWDSLTGMTPLCAPAIVGGTDTSPSPTPTTETTASPSPTPTTAATASPSPTPTTAATASPSPTPTTETTASPSPTPTTAATASPSPTPTTAATASPFPTPTPTPVPTTLPGNKYDDWLQGQTNDTSTDGAKEETEYEGKTALGVCRNVYKLYGETMVAGASMTFETYAYYASGSAGFRIVLENASASAAQNSGKIVEAITAGSGGTFGTAGETTLTSAKTGWFKAVIKIDYAAAPTVTASLYDPDGAAVFENTNVPVPSDVTDKNVKAIRLVSREGAGSGIYTYFADMKASFIGAATPDPNAPTPSPKPTPHPTAPPKPTTAPTAEPTFPDVELPESKAWTVNDTALNEMVLAVTTKGEAFGPYDGLNGYGEWININVAEVKYTHNGKSYTFTHGWQAGTGSATERNFYFTPEAECTVTVAYKSPADETSDRPLYICQGGVEEADRLMTGTDAGTDAAPAEMSVDITDISKGNVYIVGGSKNKYVYGIFVDYKKSKLYGTITHEGGTDMTDAKIVFTDASDPSNKYETDFADTYAIAVENGKTYNISVVDANGAPIGGVQPVKSTVTVNGDTRFDVKIADLNTTLVTGDVVVHEYTPNDGATLDLSQVTLKFTDKNDAQNVVTVPAGSIENNRYSVLLKPGKTYTVTAENAEGYTLSPFSGEYALPSGETGCFKNILLTENLGEVPFNDTIEVGWDRTYTRINDAMAAIKKMERPEGEDGRVTILLDNGVYQEQAIIDADYVTLKAAIAEYKPIITFYYGIGYRYYSSNGESGDDTDHAAGGYYDEDLAVQKTKKGNVDRWGPVVRVTGDYFKAENVIFANSFNCQIVQAELDDGVEPSIYSDTSKKPDRTVKGFDPLTTDAVERAAALAADGNYYEFKGCEFISSQDTLFTNNVGYFRDCYIEGGTDYIFGGNSVIFDRCTLAWHGYTGKAKGGYITACKTAAKPTAGTPDLQSNGYLMKNCTVSKSKYYKHNFEAGGWGRNWGGENCQVVFDGVTIASGADVPGTWVAMRKAEENKPFSFSILYVNNVKKADGTTVDSSGETFNPNGTMAANGYTVMNDQSYFGSWTPDYYE